MPAHVPKSRSIAVRPVRTRYFVPTANSMIYLDHQATTPVDTRVLAALLPYLGDSFGNASSVQHERGRLASRAADCARDQVAALLAAREDEIVFTSGATESNNLALLGLASSMTAPGHIVTSAIEHPSVLEPLKRLEIAGWRISRASVDSSGIVDLDEIDALISPETALVSIMLANNEIGSVEPIARVVELAHSRGVPVHTDAVQAVPGMRIDVGELGVDLLSLSAHKFYGPPGVGALFVRREIRSSIKALTFGGGHEGGLRSGTTNTPGVVGMGVAAELLEAARDAELESIRDLRNLLKSQILECCGEVVVNGPSPGERLPGSLHVTFPHAQADAVMANCPDVCMAAGSSCASSAPTPSHVLRAIGLSDDAADCSIRLGVGRFTTEDEVLLAASKLGAAVEHVRGLTEASEPADGMAE